MHTREPKAPAVSPRAGGRETGEGGTTARAAGAAALPAGPGTGMRSAATVNPTASTEMTRTITDSNPGFRTIARASEARTNRRTANSVRIPEADV